VALATLKDPTVPLNKLNKDEFEMFEYWKYSANENDLIEDESIFNNNNDIPNDLSQYYELKVGFGYPKDKNE